MMWWGAEGLAQRGALPCGLSLAPSSAADVASGSLSPCLHLTLYSSARGKENTRIIITKLASF